MQTVIVEYRNIKHYIDIDPTNLVIDLKNAVSKETGIESENFNLQLDKVILLDTKPISLYPQNGNHFRMIDVRISITVILNQYHNPYTVPELRTVGDFARDIIRLSGHDTDITLCYNGQKLEEKDTLLSCGVVDHSILTTINGKVIINTIRRVTFCYRIKSYPIDVDETKTVVQFKELISKQTGIKVENFCLKLGNCLLIEDRKMIKYLPSGINFTMVNVTIMVNVILNGKNNILYVHETTKINDFIKEIITATGHEGGIYLYYHNCVLVGTDTVLSSGIMNKSIVIAVVENAIISKIQAVTVKYRYNSYMFEIDTTKTVLEMKQLVSEKADIKAEHFSLQFYWILLEDSKPISEYLKFGTNFTMTNATINVLVKFNGQNFNFSVKERMTIDDFKKEIIKKTAHKNDIYLVSNEKKLVGTATLLSSEVENNGSIVAMGTIIGAMNP